MLMLLCVVKPASISLMDIEARPSIARSKPVTEMMLEGGPMTADTVMRGDTVKFRYYMINRGADSLFVSGINPDCICTSFRASSMNAAPGDSIYLDLIIDTDHKFGQNLIRTIFEVNTKEQMYIIRSPFYVRYDSVCDVDSLGIKKTHSFKKLIVGEHAKCKSTVINYSSESVVLEVLSSCRCLSVTPDKIVLGPNSRAEYAIDVCPTNPGEYSEYFMVRKIGSKNMTKVVVRGDAV